MQILIGAVLGISVGYAAYRLGALATSGAFAAAVIGGIVFGFGGSAWASLLLLFFISSSLLSRAYRKRKQPLSEKFAKGARRDLGQVLANGGSAAALTMLHWYFPQQEAVWVAFAGSLAAVNADTWATELGVLSSKPPRLITSGAMVPQGTSGGVTLVGYLATVAGASLIALAAGFFVTPAAQVIAAVILGGLAGATVDSILGATVQSIYYCPACKKETESYPLHHCGTRTQHIRGWRWLNNDLVNFTCALVGAGLAAGVWVLLS